MKIKILIVEDQFIEANNLRTILEREGYWVFPIVRSVASALKSIDHERPHLVMLDIHLQGKLTGIDLAKKLQEKNIAFIFLSANSTREVLDHAKATKPYGFLVKPFRAKDILVMLDVAWYLHMDAQRELKNAAAKPTLGTGDGYLKSIVGQSPDILEVSSKIKTVSQSDISVLILGESGTGKELVAQAIHRMSARAQKPLMVVNCGALPADLIESELFGHERGAFTGAMNLRIGKFEQANGGTIFLDEVGELPLDLQVKFLRVLQEREIERIGGQSKKIDIRVIAATNKNLEDEVAEGRFRMDLYYRLNVFPIALPPLRERRSDISLLADYFLNKISAKEGKIITGFSKDIVDLMQKYSWPGNIREMENLVARSVLLSDGPVIDSMIFPTDKLELGSFEGDGRLKTMEENERDYIVSVLKVCNWKVYGPGGAAEVLNMNVSTLNSRIKKLGVSRHPNE